MREDEEAMSTTNAARRFFVVFVAAVLLFLACGAFSSAQASPAVPHSRAVESSSQSNSSAHAPFVLIGMSGIDVTAMNTHDPVIRAALEKANVASMTARSVPTFTCPSEGWMSLVASGDVIDDQGRERATHSEDPCTPLSLASGNTSGLATIDGFAELTAPQSWPQSSPYPGALAIGEGAALTVADSSGNAAPWYPLSPESELAELVANASGDVFIDLGTVRAEPDSPAYTQQVDDLMGRLSRVLGALDALELDRTQIIASLADSSATGSLQFVAITPASASDSRLSHEDKLTPGPAIIHSSSTRATGLITIADLRSYLQGDRTILSSSPTPSIDEALHTVDDFVDHTYTAYRSTAKWYQAFNWTVIVVALATILLFFVKPTRAGRENAAPQQWWRALAGLNTWAYAFVPAALVLNFLPWWRIPWTSHSAGAAATAIGLTALLAAAITVVARKTSSPLGAISALALGVLCIDVIAGSSHQINGFMGSLVLTSRRFYGISNRTYLILIIAGLLTLLLFVRWTRHIALVTGAVGVIVLLVDALPAWGADFGGPPGIIAAFILAAVLLSGRRLRWRHGVLWLVLTVSSMGAVALLDSRSGGESHIGRFWTSIGTDDNINLLLGKVRDVLRSFTSRPSTIATLVFIFVAVIALTLALRRLDQRGSKHLATLRDISREGYIRPLIFAVLAGIAIAVPINDSGALMIKEGFYIAAPAFLALVTSSMTKRDYDPELQNNQS
ncbi:hypothetical protein I6E29_03485 [Arcanobacterium haemolyticum]|nr:hypothetical protein [Arcanobacterium haemolyticum]